MGTAQQPATVQAMQGLRCIRVAAGLAHTAVCTADGACYCFGWNADGQLGTGTTVSLAEPSLVQGQAIDAEDIVQVGSLEMLCRAADASDAA